MQPVGARQRLSQARQRPQGATVRIAPPLPRPIVGLREHAVADADLPADRVYLDKDGQAGPARGAGFLPASAPAGARDRTCSA
eukprot:776393-Pyramimonas_sp.AAC.1